jgi:hypothetical protein
VETLLTTNFNTPSFWMLGRKLFEAAVVVIKDADEAERMHACLEQATAASQAEDTFAVGKSSVCTIMMFNRYITVFRVMER